MADATLAEAVRRGWVTPPVIAGEAPPEGAAVAPLSELMEELRRDRDAR